MICSDRARRSRACSGVTVPPLAPSMQPPERRRDVLDARLKRRDRRVCALRPSSSFHEIVGSMTVPCAFRNAIVSLQRVAAGRIADGQVRDVVDAHLHHFAQSS